MIYNLIYAFTVLANIATSGRFDLRRALYNLVLVFFFLFAAFRWNVGCDFDGYREHTERFAGMQFSEAFALGEPGYWLTFVVLERLGIAFPAINVVAAFVFFLGVHALAKRQPDPLMFLTLLFPVVILNMPMSAIRQAAAIGILCLAFNAFQDRRPGLFAAFVLLASTFHQSASAFICLLPLILFRGFQARLFLAVPLVITAAYLLGTGQTAVGYTDAYVGTVDAAGGLGRVLSVALAGVVFFVFLRKRWKAFSPVDYDLVLLFSAMMIALVPLVSYSSVIGDRFGYYISIIANIVLSKGYLMYTGSMRTILFLFPFTMLLFILIVWSQFSLLFQACYMPYQTWLF